jgi:hypothetical protein
MSSAIPLAGYDYDVAADYIACNADKIGAKIFTVTNGYGRKVRVLAWNEADARATVCEWHDNGGCLE